MKKSNLTIDGARQLLRSEEIVVKVYNYMIRSANEYFETNSISARPEEDQIMFRKASVCDYHRILNPDSKLTDEEIIDNLQKMDEQ